MDRLACVDLPALPLQLLLRRHPDWRGHPVAVVAEDRPQAFVQWVNEEARRYGVLPGQRYAAALSLTRDLRARVVPPGAIGAAVAACVTRLRQRTPFIEPAAEQPGVFWLDASGLVPLYGSVAAWAEAVAADLAALGFEGAVVVGFTRFGTYALARTGTMGIRVLTTPEEERAAAARVPLDRLSVDPRLRDRLRRLEVRTVGDFLALPPSGVLRRFGPEAHHLHRLAADTLYAPLRPEIPERPAGGRLLIEPPETDVYALLFRVKRLLDPALRSLYERGRGAAGVRLWCALDHEAPVAFQVRPAAPTPDAALLLDLVRLRLEQTPFSAGVVELRLTLDDAPVDPEQLRLFALPPRQDRAAAERALARIRADLGEHAVGRFFLREGHLPEAQFSFGPLEALPAPRPRYASPMLMRRIFTRPVPLPFQHRVAREDGWQPPQPEQGPILRVVGPYVVSGGWWQGEVQREYAFAETERGDLLWIFRDALLKRWFQQGMGS